MKKYEEPKAPVRLTKRNEYNHLIPNKYIILRKKYFSLKCARANESIFQDLVAANPYAFLKDEAESHSETED